MLRLCFAGLLAVGCRGLALHEFDDDDTGLPAEPLSLQRGEVTSAAGSELQATANFEANLLAQTAECVKNQSIRHVSGAADATMFNRPWNKDMLFIRDSQAWGQLPPVAMPAKGDHVKVAFLMFANDRVHNEEVWLHWMEQAKGEDIEFMLLIHAYGLPPRGTAEWKSERFSKYLVKDQVRTTWCQMWEAQMLMMEKALTNDHVTHVMMVSSDSVPVKPMSWIHKEISNDPLSRFCVDDYWRTPWPRAETWSLMRRGDVEVFVKNKEWAAKHLRRDCEEELGWYFPLRARWGNWGEKAAVSRECVMFTNWKDGEKACKEAWAENADKCKCKKLRRSNQTAAGFKHPVTYHKLGKTEFEELVRSPFWFARKFSEGAIGEKLKTVLDIDITKPQRRFSLWR